MKNHEISSLGWLGGCDFHTAIHIFYCAPIFHNGKSRRTKPINSYNRAKTIQKEKSPRPTKAKPLLALGFLGRLESSGLFDMPISKLEVLFPVKISHIMCTRAHVVTDGVTYGLID